MNTIKLPRQKPCKVCREKFQPTRAIQPTCQNFACQLAYAEQVAAKSAKKREQDNRKKERAETLARKEKLKGRDDYKKEVDEAFQRYVRYRDKDELCICCGMPLRMDGPNYSIGGYYDAGHYVPRKHMATRWDEANCHAQRKYCNGRKGGNYVGYRIGLIARIGEVEVLRLEAARNQIRKYTIPDLIELRDHYRAKLRMLKQQERKAA
jgi:hypothetical protein